MGHLSPQECIARLAQRLGVSEEEAGRFCQAQAELAVELAAQGYCIPGVAVLRSKIRPERVLPLLFGPDKGKEARIPARTVVMFRVSSVVRKAIVEGASTIPDVSRAETFDADDATEGSGVC